MFDKKIAIFRQHAKNKDDALKILSEKFIEAGVVKENFTEGILNREKYFPTGLDTYSVGVAIPHTDSEYVIKDQLGFMTLDRPIKFKSMADPEKDVKVKIIFMMALKGQNQVDMLMKLMVLFKDENFLKKLSRCKDYETFEDLMKQANLL